MKKIKLLLSLSCLALVFGLSSCDFSMFFKDSTKTTEEKTDNNNTENTTGENEKTSTEEKNTETTDDTTKTSTEEKNTETTDDTTKTPTEESNTGTADDSYDLSIYLNDYKEKSGYQSLASDEEHGELMQSAYANFYEASKNLLLSKEDISIDTSKLNGETITFLNVFTSEGFETQSDIQYYQSAWSVFIAENPIFYFLSNGTLSRSSVETVTEKQGNKIISENKVTTYSFILIGYDTFATFAVRNEMNKKLDNVFKSTSAIKDIGTDYEKVIAISDYLNENLTYAYKEDKTPEDSYWAHNIIGLLDNKKGVCECYAKSFELLTDYYNVNAISVYGITDGNEAHAWNYVNIDEVWYGMDATWNDSIKEKNPSMATNELEYFLCSNSTMAKKHTPYATLYGLSYQATPPILSEVAYTVS